MNKIRLTFLIVLLFSKLWSQHAFPDYLNGKWVSTDGGTIEQWNLIERDHLKGVGFSVKNGIVNVVEYLEIKKKGKSILYTALVPEQNNGKTVCFKLVKSRDTLFFVNEKHDFPNKIQYVRVSENELDVTVSGGTESFSYRLQREDKKSSDTTATNPNYNESLAKELGADDYGMRSYYFVILKTGPNKTTDKSFISACFDGHMSNMEKLVDAGNLIVAGPFAKNDLTYRGLFIISAETKEELNNILSSDPAIKEGLLEAEVLNWYGSAALKMYLQYSDQIWKSKP
jgi:uncharacterized protein YciI